MKELTKVEETVLISILKAGDEAYGVVIQEEIRRITGKKLLYNTLYSVLDQLAGKGYLQKRYGEPTAVRGGKRKIFFGITPEGMTALESAYRNQQALWSGISEKSFVKGGIYE